MLIKDLSASIDLDRAAMTAVRGGQAENPPGQVTPPLGGPIGATNGSVNPQVVISTYNYHDYYHPYIALRR